MRQKYRITVEDKNGIWRDLDLGSDTLAWTYQVNDIAELVSRGASYSQSLKLPLTSNNVQIFDYANVFNSITETPYRKHNCRVFCADRAIAGKGSFLIIIRTGEFFECQILSGNASFFDALQESPMSDLDLGVFQICYNSMNPASWHPACEVAFGSDIVISSYPFRKEDLSRPGIPYLRGAGGKYPVISIDYTINAILSKHGYTLTSNIDSWKNKYLSINSADVEPTEEDLTYLQGRITAETTQLVDSTNYFVLTIMDNADMCLLQQTATRMYYFVPCGQTVEFTVQTYSLLTSDGSTQVEFERVSGGKVYSKTFAFDGTNKTDTFTFANETGALLMPLIITATAVNVYSLMGRAVIITSKVIVAGLPSNAGGKLVLSERTGFETQLDYMKFFAQAFGLTFVVDETTKHVHAYTMQLLYDNIKSNNTADWSGKVEKNPKYSMSFTLDDYAQENIISLEDDDKNDLKDSAKFYIDNQTLKASKEALKLGIGAGKDVNVYSSNTGTNEISASIPLIELKPFTDEEEDPYAVGYERYLLNASFPTIKPHLVELSERTVPVNVSPINMSYIFNYRIATHVTAQQIADAGYSVLADKLLRHAKVIEDKFFLTPEDMEQFNPSIPVWIEKYGAYFYVNMIKNFVPGQLTTVELIKL